MIQDFFLEKKRQSSDLDDDDDDDRLDDHHLNVIYKWFLKWIENGSIFNLSCIDSEIKFTQNNNKQLSSLSDKHRQEKMEKKFI